MKKMLLALTLLISTGSFAADMKSGVYTNPKEIAIILRSMYVSGNLVDNSCPTKLLDHKINRANLAVFKIRNIEVSKTVIPNTGKAALEFSLNFDGDVASTISVACEVTRY